MAKTKHYLCSKVKSAKKSKVFTTTRESMTVLLHRHVLYKSFQDVWVGIYVSWAAFFFFILTRADFSLLLTGQTCKLMLLVCLVRQQWLSFLHPLVLPEWIIETYMKRVIIWGRMCQNWSHCLNIQSPGCKPQAKAIWKALVKLELYRFVRITSLLTLSPSKAFLKKNDEKSK